jgi:hypothetical protein
MKYGRFTTEARRARRRKDEKTEDQRPKIEFRKSETGGNGENDERRRHE